MNQKEFQILINVILIMIFISLIAIIHYLIKIKNQNSKKKLVDYLHKIRSDKNLPPNYIADKYAEIAIMEWLILYYDGKTTLSPEAYFNILMSPNKPSNPDSTLRQVKFLYFWINSKKITGF